MGSTTSKHAGANLELCRLSRDSGHYSLPPYQNESINSDSSDGEGMIKRDNSSDGFDSNEDDSNNHLSDRSSLPLIPQTPTRASSCGSEVANAWEVIEGIEDFTSINTWELVDASELSPSEIASDDIAPQLNNETTSGKSPLSSKCCKSLQLLGIVRARVNSFERKIEARRRKNGSLSSTYPSAEKKKVVFYFTSLTGVTSTHEDCKDARRILQGYGVCLDERDVLMDAGFKEELSRLLGMSFGGKLPRVFVDDCYIGGAEEVRKLHVSGELQNVLQGCMMKPVGKDGNFELCPGCTDERFLPCLSCSGSCRVYLESSEEGENNIQFQRCQDCNEHGFIRCPVCW